MKNITRGSKAGGTASANGPAKPSTKVWTPPALITNPLDAAPFKATLTAKEQTELAELETVIRAGWKTFLEVGTALAKVRDKKLFRDKYGTFENYCQAELGFSRPYAYNLIGSAEVSKQLSSIEDIKVKPVNEAQCRELIRLKEDERVKAWKKAVELAGDNPVTAKIVHEAAAKVKPPDKKTKAAKKVAALNVEPGLKLIEAIEKLADSDDTDKLMKKLAELRAWLKKAGK